MHIGWGASTCVGWLGGCVGGEVGGGWGVWGALLLYIHNPILTKLNPIPRRTQENAYRPNEPSSIAILAQARALA